MTRISLLSALLILGLIGVMAGWWSADRRAARKIVALQQENDSLQGKLTRYYNELRRYREKSGQLLVTDTNKVQALFVRPSPTSPQNHWRWRVYLPDGHAYRLHVQTEDVAAELPVHEDKLDRSKSESAEIVQRGEILLDLHLAEAFDRKVLSASVYRTLINQVAHGTRLSKAIPWFTFDLVVSYSVQGIQYPIYPSVVIIPTPKAEWQIGEEAIIFSAHHVDENVENEGLVVWISSSAE